MKVYAVFVAENGDSAGTELGRRSEHTDRDFPAVCAEEFLDLARPHRIRNG